MTTTPSIALIGVIGQANNPLHISIFPSAITPASPSIPSTPIDGSAPSPSAPTELRPLLTPIQASLLLSTSLDIFEARRKRNATSGGGLTQDFGLLKNVDERLAIYGWETNTRVRFVVGIDLMGRRVEGDGRGRERKRAGGVVGAAMGVKEGEIQVIFKAIQTAYIKLLQNPFYDPDEHSPLNGKGGKRIESKKFKDEIQRIGEMWRQGATTL